MFKPPAKTDSKDLIKVIINFYGITKDVVDRKKDEAYLPEDATVRDLLELLANRYGTGFKEKVFTLKGNLQQSVKVVIDGHVIDYNRLDTALGKGEKKGVEMFIFPSIAGGSPPLS